MTSETDTKAGTDRALSLEFRSPGRDDGAAMWRIADESGLDLNSQYAYLMVGEFFGATSIVADAGGEIAGFISGFCPPESPDDLFVWQIAVKNSWQGQGIASRMLDELTARHKAHGGRFVTATISPSNEASQKTFQSLARRLGTEWEKSPLFGEELFDGDEHEAEEFYRIGPI